jgi:hypothetical protein
LTFGSLNAIKNLNNVFEENVQKIPVKKSDENKHSDRNEPLRFSLSTQLDIPDSTNVAPKTYQSNTSAEEKKKPTATFYLGSSSEGEGEEEKNEKTLETNKKTTEKSHPIKNAVYSTPSKEGIMRRDSSSFFKFSDFESSSSSSDEEKEKSLDKVSQKTLNSLSTSSGSSSSSSSSTNSSSESESSSDSESDDTQILKENLESKTERYVNTMTEKELIGFDLSSSSEDEEGDNKNDEEESLINVSDLRREFESNPAVELDQIIEESQKSTLQEQEAISKLSDQIINSFIEEIIDKSVNENYILDFIINKLITEEIGNNKETRMGQLLIRTARECYEEARKERREELRQKFETEIFEQFLDDNLKMLSKECADRVLAEMKLELLESIFNELLDDFSDKKNIENILFETIFEDMRELNRPLIDKISALPPPPEPLPLTSSLSLHQQQKRRISTSSDAESIKSSCSSHILSNTGTPSKKMKSSGLYDEIRDTAPFLINNLNNEPDPYSKFEHTEAWNLIEDFVKECLSEYFRKYNFKNSFTFDELDEIIDRLARNVYGQKDTIDTKFCSQFVSRMLLKVCIKFILKM